MPSLVQIFPSTSRMPRGYLLTPAAAPASRASLVLRNSTGYSTVVAVPPASPALPRDEHIRRSHLQSLLWSLLLPFLLIPPR